MSIFTGDTGGGGTAFGPLTWNTNNPGSAATFYLLPVEGSPDANEYVQIVAGPGTYTQLKVVSTGALVTDSMTLTVRKNGVDTALVAMLAAGQASVLASGSVAVVAGDRISVKIVQSGTEATSPRLGIGLY
jgi:hypothetical protein